MPSSDDPAARNSVPLILSLVALPTAVAVWFSAVSSQVGEPYLDEVFHVGQVQQYCRGNYWHWDPKITTPPGLYFLSVIFYKITGRCDLDALRFINVLCLLAIFFFLLQTVPPVAPRSKQEQSARLSGSTSSRSSLADLCPQQIHCAFNICLFPPLFFFCALYYTDVASTLSVLLFLKQFLATNSHRPATFLNACISVLLGIISLSFRQTNIFWVAVLPIALLLVNALHEDVDDSRPANNRTVILDAWKKGIFYDAQMRDATVDDFLVTCISLATLAVRCVYQPNRLLRLVRVMWPYITLLALFGSFVVWNGSVVLGDKSNHVATLHLAQMLYLWVYTTFFSFALVYPFIAQALLAMVAAIPVVTLLEPLLIFSRRKFLPRSALLVGFIALCLAIVKYNTIVHPFTLADNRHFTFYVFRILLRHPAIRFLVVPLYIASAWAVLQTLGAPAQLFRVVEDEKDDGNGPSSLKREGQTTGNEKSFFIRLNNAPFGEGTTISFVLVWVSVSALQLITAPLVEPRYFILPWIMWRLRVPQAHPGASIMTRPTHKNWQQWWNKEKQRRKIHNQSWLNWIRMILWAEHDHRLHLETAWFVIVNVVVGKIFLHWGFEWEQEPGKTQRFMW